VGEEASDFITMGSESAIRLASVSEALLLVLHEIMLENDVKVDLQELLEEQRRTD
jgi:hypothetical protein